MKIERFCIQSQPKCALAPVRVLRVTDDTNDEGKSYLHVGHRCFDRPEDLARAIESFAREFPKGRIEVETPDCEIHTFRASDFGWLFGDDDHAERRDCERERAKGLT